MKIKILESAMDDLHHGKLFYDKQQLGIGDYFQDCLFSDIDSLYLYAGIHKVIYGYHRLLSKRFPYAIYYKMESDDVVIIYRVLDCRRNPLKTKKALE